MGFTGKFISFNQMIRTHQTKNLLPRSVSIQTERGIGKRCPVNELDALDAEKGGDESKRIYHITHQQGYEGTVISIEMHPCAIWNRFTEIKKMKRPK
jgi:hypothetical protein